MIMVSELFKFILGFILAIAILIAGGFATALYMMNRVSAPPPKPIYANDKPEVKAQAPKSETPKSAPYPPPEAILEDSPSPSPSPTQTPKAEEELKEEPLPPGAYHARVTWQQGLIMRKEPTPDAERIGGAAFNQRVIVLEESSDKAWLKIRSQNGEQEGWVKAGNIKQVNDEQTEQ